MATSRPGFCRICKIGTFDADGLCILCGAPAAPLSPPRRALAAALAALTSAPALALYAVLVTGGGGVALWQYLGPTRAPALLRAGPLGAAAGGLGARTVIALLIGPAILALVVLIVLFLLSRRGGRGRNLLTGRHEAA